MSAHPAERMPYCLIAIDGDALSCPLSQVLDDLTVIFFSADAITAKAEEGFESNAKLTVLAVEDQ